MRVRDLEAAAHSQDPSEFRAQLGEFVLLQRPPAPVYAEMAKLLGRGPTIGMAHQARMGDEILAMAAAFASLTVLPLADLGAHQEQVVGRAPECSLVIHEPSVSGRHAAIRQDEKAPHCLLVDLGSRNGTFVNARRIDQRETPLVDGDAISFGDAQFLFLSAESLRRQLVSFAGG